MTSLSRMRAGSAVPKNARTSSRKAFSSGVKRRSMRGSFLFQCSVIPGVAKRRPGIHSAGAWAWVPDSGCAASGMTAGANASSRRLPQSRLLALLLDELLLRELADGGAREVVADLERHRHLVAADLVDEEGAQRLERQRRRAGAERDEGLRGLAAIGVGHADD